MYFSTTSNQVWTNNAGGPFSLQAISGMTGSVTTLNGNGTYGEMYFSTSTNQVWTSNLGAPFGAVTINGNLTGNIIQFVGDGVGYACFLTSTSQIWCGFGSSFNLFYLSGGVLSGRITNIIGVLNATIPINIQFFTSTNQLWVQDYPGGQGFSLAGYSSSNPTGLITAMGSSGSGYMYFATTTGEIWKNFSNGAYSSVATNGTVLGTVNLMVGNNGYMYFITTTGQVWGNYNGGVFNLISVNYSGSISQLSGSGGYIYFLTNTGEVWANFNGSTFTQLE